MTPMTLEEVSVPEGKHTIKSNCEGDGEISAFRIFLM